MDWNKAKNLIIIFLAALNVFLFVCNKIYVTDRYYMSNERVRNITEVLEKSEITLDCSFSREFSPKRQLVLGQPRYDHEDLRDMFMKDAKHAKFSMEDSRFVYRTDWETLIINILDGYVSYKNRDITNNDPDPILSEALCEGFLLKMGLADFTLDSGEPYKTDDGLTFEYRQKYNGYIINSNSAVISVGDNGISSIKYSYAPPTGFSDEKRQICAEDEALLTCMYELQNIYGYSPLSITKIDLVYLQTEKNLAVPFYRIYADNAPVLVNAYDNTVYRL
ncbi:hypothetical protein AGMMS49975_02490 [Clostridia bacterium]|nr:hypothetical protein AGMMS49975_02490 [Clostridia bacterium]